MRRPGSLLTALGCGSPLRGHSQAAMCICSIFPGPKRVHPPSCQLGTCLQGHLHAAWRAGASVPGRGRSCHTESQLRPQPAIHESIIIRYLCFPCVRVFLCTAAGHAQPSRLLGRATRHDGSAAAHERGKARPDGVPPGEQGYERTEGRVEEDGGAEEGAQSPPTPTPRHPT